MHERRRRPLLVATLAAGIILAACSGNTHSSPVSGVTPTSTIPASTTVVAHTTKTTAAPTPDAARAALDGFLAALVAHDETAVLAHSQGAAAALGALRVLAANVDAASGATNTTRVQDETFQPQSVKRTSVVFAGSVGLATDVSQPTGTQTALTTISGPVTVALVNTTWLVNDFVYDGTPVTYHAENATDTKAGIQLHVAYVLSYANFTSAVVLLTGPKQETLSLTSAALTTAAGTTVSTGSGFTKVAPRSGFIVFARTDAVPARLAASFRQPDGSTIAFTVALTA